MAAQNLPTWKELFAEVRKETRSSRYSFRSEVEDAPTRVNCLTLVVWIFKLCGITLPYDLVRIIDASSCVRTIVDVTGVWLRGDIYLPDYSETWIPGDILLVEGRGYYDHPDYGKIGHLGIVTEKYDILHATRRQQGTVCGVIEESLEQFLAHHGPLRTARRLF